MATQVFLQAFFYSLRQNSFIHLPPPEESQKQKNKSIREIKSLHVLCQIEAVTPIWGATYFVWCRNRKWEIPPGPSFACVMLYPGPQFFLLGFLLSSIQSFESLAGRKFILRGTVTPPLEQRKLGMNTWQRLTLQMEATLELAKVHSPWCLGAKVMCNSPFRRIWKAQETFSSVSLCSFFPGMITPLQFPRSDFLYVSFRTCGNWTPKL